MIPPINNLINLIFLIITIYILFSFKLLPKLNKSYLAPLLLFISLLISLQIQKKDIEEGHSVFLNENDLKIINQIIPNEILNKMKEDLKKLDIGRYIQSHDGPNFNSIDNFKKANFIEKPFSFSVDNFFGSSNLSRTVNSINFNTRETLRVGHFNTLKYNLAFDKELRREMPFYVLYDIPKKYKNSKVCSLGKVYYVFYNDSKKNKINELNFNSLSNINNYECIILDEKYDNYKFIGYSINKNDPLNIKLTKNSLLQSLDLFIYLLITLSLVTFTKLVFIKKNNFREISIVFMLSSMSTFIFTYIKDNNLLFGLRYFRGGADGLLNSARSQEIVFNLKNYEFLEALKGGSEIFYYMPGLRYFGAFSNIIFGDTSFGYLIIAILLPLFLYVLIKNLTNKKIAIISIISFLFVPILENLGFGHFNYVHQVVRNHSETLAITFIIFCLSKFSAKDFFSNNNILKLFIYTAILSLVTFIRPNFFPLVFIFTIYLIYGSYKAGFGYVFVILIAFSFNFLSLFHNIYFGDSLTLFTQSNIHFIFNNAFMEINNKFFNSSFILEQFLRWNPIYNIHRLLVLLFISFCIIKYRSSLFLVCLYLACISQHGVLLLTHPDSRYAYLAWLLTTIIFIYFIHYFIKEKIYLKLRKKMLHI